MSNRNPETIERMHSLVFRRLQASDREGINVCELAPMIQSEFGGTTDYCRNVLINLAHAGKIFRKMVSGPHGGLQGRYFYRQEWCDAYVQHHTKPKKGDAAYVPTEKTIPTFGVIGEREIKVHEFGPGITIKPGVKVQVCTQYDGDYRIKVDPAHIGGFTKEWQEKRAQA